MSTSWAWYLRRLSRMTPGEVSGRSLDAARRAWWQHHQVDVARPVTPPVGLVADRRFTSPLPACARGQVAQPARAALLAAADRILAGQGVVLGRSRRDLADPDWFLDPVTGRRAPDRELAFRIDHRDEARTGNVKAVWELSRHHHLTVLASAYWLSGDSGYAEATARQLRSWWAANPFLTGVHWTSGIELGVRLISWAWIRRLLDDWSGVTDLFEQDDTAVRQLWWHQRYLAAFPSRGSSANNHLVAEAAGLFIGACAFPWFRESDRWRKTGRSRLEGAFAANTFPSGVNRELATDYHRFVAELVAAAAVEADAAGAPLADETWGRLASVYDVAAALPDAQGRPPRQGDGDEGRALVLDDPESAAWPALLGTGARLVGALPWWRGASVGVTATATALAALGADHRRSDGRPRTRPDRFADAGITLLRSSPEEGPEIWCRCDGGPHGFLSIAAHAHADALSVEVRYDGVELLVDPGTYCYHGEPDWRAYFRSTLAHNTVELGGRDQSVSGGPFLWTRAATTRPAQTGGDARLSWAASHDGYARLGGPSAPVRHRRRVDLERCTRKLVIRDAVDGTNLQVRLAFHLGPDVSAVLDGHRARLSWPGEHGGGTAVLALPAALDWRAHRGSTEPILGWFAPRFGCRVPITTLVGTTQLIGHLDLHTELRFEPAHPPGPQGVPHAARHPERLEVQA